MKQLILKIIGRIRGEQSLEKLVHRGLRIGNNFQRMSGCIIDPSHCWHITIGDDVVFAPNVHVLAHDASTKIFLNFTRIANVKIGNRVFVGAGSVILPGVTIGDDVVIGAGSVVSRNVPDKSVAAGSPAKVICSLEEYIEKENKNMNEANVFGCEYTLRNPRLSDEHKRKMIEACELYGESFVE